MSVPLPLLDRPAPEVRLAHLDELWFQVTGTLCNLTCRHCFISCSPHNRSVGLLSLETVERILNESVALGVKEYYFTGGEPFLHPDMVAILERTLQFGPATVLTNGTVLRDDWLDRLARAERDSIYSLEVRVSIDGATAETNDPVRGEGTFERAMHGVEKLLAHGFLPLITVARTSDEQDDAELFAGFVTMLKQHGYARPRVKVLPTLRLGAEVQRQRGYTGDEFVTPEMMEGFDPGLLLCSHARLVSDRGVHVCPILLEAPDSVLGTGLADASKPFALRHHACSTCYQHGAICANPSAAGRPA
jgi:sulfatase maturation enzyme AslB (radical SAM superfamily)